MILYDIYIFFLGDGGNGKYFMVFVPQLALALLINPRWRVRLWVQDPLHACNLPIKKFQLYKSLLNFQTTTI